MLIDEALFDSSMLTDQRRANLSQILCDKKTGCQVDGVLFCNQNSFSDYYKQEHPYDTTMRMFNPDGSEAEMCGNGLRCAGRYDIEKNQRNPTLIATPKEVLSVAQVNDIFPHIPSYQSEIGPIDWHIPRMKIGCRHAGKWVNQPLSLLDDILDSRVRYSALSIPNPHLIAISPVKFSPESVHQSWQLLSSNGMFAEGINFSVVNYLGHGRIFVTTCERGAGPTHACGTAMAASCAVVIESTEWMKIGEMIEVFNLGGMVLCDAFSQIETNKILVIGNASWITKFHAMIDLQAGKVLLNTIQQYTEHQNNYQQLQSYAQKITQQ